MTSIQYSERGGRAFEVLILGDSSSFARGLAPENYVAGLANTPVWPMGTKIVNPSVGGLGSADQARFYFRYVRAGGRPDVVVVYLGNCDSCGTHVRKGRYDLWARLRFDWLGRSIDPHRRRGNRLRPWVFDPIFDPALEPPEDPSDFAYNLGQITADAGRHGAAVILINGIANRDLPAGLGKGNFIFYRYFDLAERIAEDVQEAPESLVAALRAEESGEVAQAIDRYLEILRSTREFPGVEEVKQIAANNLAVALARAGDHPAALSVLQSLLDQSPARPEIMLYNLSRISAAAGDHRAAEDLLSAAYEADTSLYRIRGSYRQAIANIAAREAAKLGLIDLNEFLGSRHFIDHCHLLPEGHAPLRDRIVAELRRWPQYRAGNSTARIEHVSTNMEYALGNDSSLDRYFYLDRSERDGDPGFARARQLALQHPLFPSTADLLGREPRHDWERGRLPDPYLVRLILPYIRYFWAEGLDQRFPDTIHPPSVAQYLSLLPIGSRDLLAHDELGEDGRERAERIKSSLIAKLTEHLAQGCQIDRRRKTVMYWYSRESLRYGGHSRLSMLYDRPAVDQLIEGLAGLAVISARLSLAMEDWILDFAATLGDVVAVHERGVRDFRAIGETAIAGYESGLRRIAAEFTADAPAPKLVARA